MTALFRRVVSVAVAPTGSSGTLGKIEQGLGFALSNLDCVFVAKKTLKSEPNTCKLQLFNLAPETRKVLETPKKLVLRLEAGYPDTIAQIFLGEIRSAFSKKQGADIVTEIDTGDSEKEVQKSHLSLTLGAKVPTSVALSAIVRSFGIGMGNTATVAAQLDAKGSAFFRRGTVISGPSEQLMTDICRSADLEWSVQDGVIQILARGSALNDKAVYLSSDTGLVGSPTVDNKGLVSAVALIQPDLRPGRKVQFDTLSFRGGYRIQEVTYCGDTAGQEWYAKLTCKKY